MRASQLRDCPEAKLWATVLDLALEDAFATTLSLKRNGGTPSPKDRDEARRLLFDKRGPWARWRERLCWLAGIDPDAFAERMASRWGAIAELTGGTNETS